MRFRQHCVGLVVAIVALQSAPAPAQVAVEIYSNLAAFQTRLGITRVVNFDDIATAGSTPVSFQPDRYQASHGIAITGAGGGGQFVSRDFGFPDDYFPVSAPNMYAPGPVDGFNVTTDATFFAGATPGLVAGFGAFFIDVDFSFLGPSSLAIFNQSGGQIAVLDVPDGPNGSQQFLGFVTVDSASGVPIPAIFRSRLTNGSGWPGGFANEGVTLDDFTFAVPVPEPSSLTLAGLTFAAAVGRRLRSIRKTTSRIS